MILFVGGDKGFLFIESLIEAVVDVVSAIYTNLIEATPSAKNRVFAVINFRQNSSWVWIHYGLHLTVSAIVFYIRITSSGISESII